MRRSNGGADLIKVHYTRVQKPMLKYANKNLSTVS
jgi:hypothetical protein